MSHFLIHNPLLNAKSLTIVPSALGLELFWQARMTSQPNSLKETIASNPLFQAALCHPTAREKASAFLDGSEFQLAILDAWNTLGKSVLETYAARVTLNGEKSISIGEAAVVTKNVAAQILTKLSQWIQEDTLAIFGKAVTPHERTIYRSTQ
jgi:hypothetical protein